MTNLAAYKEARAKCNEIERTMLDALLRIAPQCLDPDDQQCVLGEHPHIRVIPQHHGKRIAPYTLDFAVIVTVPGVSAIQIDVECDGHEFHAMTKDQVKRDNRRNRHLRALGWTVERFSGSEIWNSAAACVAQIERTIDDEFARNVRIYAAQQWEISL